MLRTHTSTPKAASSHRYNAAKKKANRPQPQPPHRRGTFHRRLQPLYTEKHKVSCSGFLPKTEPMQHHAAITMRFAASTRKLAPIYAQNNTRTLDDNSHAAIPMRSATGDSKTPYNYAHTSRPKAASSHHYTAARIKGKPTAAATAAQTRYLSSPAAATLPTENHKVSCSGFLPKLAPIYAQNNARTLDDNSHATIPMRSATGDSKTPYNYAHTSRPKAASSHHYTAARKKGEPTAAATAAQTRYLSSPAAATLQGKTQGFVLRLPPESRAHATSCSHYNAVCSINSQTWTYLRTWQHQMTTMKQPFQCNLQPEIQEPHRTTHTGTTTSCKTHTTLHQSQFFSDVLLCSVKSHTTLHQSQFFSDVLLCSVKSHTTLHQGQFFSDVLL